MKFTLSWLKDHLDTGAGADAIADTLTMIGLEVEQVVDRGAGLERFVVARVVEARPHPQADKLKVCVVDTGRETVEVVCGAPNARSGMKGVFAPVGTVIPGTGATLKKAKIRGVESSGMLLSERELGLSDEHTGIVELADDAPLGAPVAEVMGLADPLFDIAVTPNRGDCLGVRGVARDLAAAGVGTLKPLTVEPVPGRFASSIGVSLDLDAETADACPYFVGRMIRGVRNRASPEWMQRRLLAIGLRPISALVDITNYLTFDLCRPLHVFDADKVSGNLHVRLSRPGERLAALNDKEYVLDGEMTVIADDAGAEALGGVIGGIATACTEETADVFLESALFDPVRTAATGRKLGILSDARYRFERGIDPSFLVPGAEIATRMIVELCGGEASELVVAGAEPPPRPPIELRPERVRTLGGIDIAETRTETILTSLGFEIENLWQERWPVVVPPWRNDVVSEACLVEEVIRIHGYPHIPALPLERESHLPLPAVTAEQRQRGTARRTLAARGLVEAVTLSFMKRREAQWFGGADPSMCLVNPISADLEVVRPSILPNLIAAAKRNADRGIANAALFEVGPQYAGERPEDQRMVAAVVRSGRTGPRHWAQPPRAVDAFDAKADALAVLAAVGVPVNKLRVTAEAPPWYHPQRSGTAALGHAVLAAFGEIHPRILGRMDVAGPVVGCEVFLDAVPGRKKRAGTARPPLRLSPFQPLERDFAFVLADDVPAGAVIEAARSADPELITEVRLFDVFTGEALGPARKSLAITVVLQPSEHTLTDAELEAVAARIVSRVGERTGGVLRG